ncbi:TetR family transcriptional regulator [Mycolicibacterium acapulense]|uniref:TetR family transcriptional regulator n=1 Tax=Mycobacterium lehmannii TaxID=2048550 RepID=A0A124ENM7_9MYCO|nr:TetR/AcrR family transcriptional regulator [Mycobacterium lehmannii]KUI03938.1 TetR family transcriptional regulator [Mycolicibacterium acapulense]KUI11210.1 TetR family transcriptional regulator [Mycobacterium lehmannii]KUI13538.1 TetR family transcriptional regulator [Mycolicibacterium acapulense]
MREVPPQIADRLSAAAALFAERGLNDTKIEDVAAATGVPKATLYYYFAGKEDILAFLLEDVLHEIAKEVATVADGGGGSGADRLHRVIAAQLRVMAQRPASCRALIGELGRAARMPVIADKIGTAYLEPVEVLLHAGAADGSLAAVADARAAATALFGAVTITALTYLVTGEPLVEDLLTRTIHDVVFSGLRPR